MVTGPQSLIQCVIDGRLSAARYLQYQHANSCRRMRQLLRKRLLRRNLPAYTDHDDDPNIDKVRDNTDLGPKTRAKRCVWSRLDENGERVSIKPEQSLWYAMYVKNPLIISDASMHSKFRVRFRLPYANYLDLVEWCCNDSRFERWCGFKKNNKKASPIELLVLGSLRYLGRGFTFDDIEECTAISGEVHRVFLRKFVDYGRYVLYPKFVYFPKTAVEAETHMVEFALSGFPGCVGSSDCTHIATERCEYALRNQHIGQKSSHPTRTFNMTVNHRRRILHSSTGGPGSWNDQTMVRHDQFVSGIYDGTYLDDINFELKEYNKNGTIKNRKYCGGYLIVDNGYLRWSVTVPPFKVTNKIDEIRWSKWVESMRKDVECTFGILKGRFRVLKTGIRTDGINSVDDIWLTCCALHNWLLDIDGLTGEWKDGVPVSDWEGTMGLHDDDYPVNSPVPNAIARLHHNLNFRNYDLSGMGPGNDVTVLNNSNTLTADDEFDEYFPDDDDDDSKNNDVGENEGDHVLNVRHLSLKYFRRKLVRHFDIMFHHNQLRWTIR